MILALLKLLLIIVNIVASVHPLNPSAAAQVGK